MFDKFRRGCGYVINRLDERSFWSDVGIGLTGAAVLPYPYNIAAIVVCVIKALIPDGSVGIKK